jgi:Domain of unknown function (DUF4349)
MHTEHERRTDVRRARRTSLASLSALSAVALAPLGCGGMDFLPGAPSAERSMDWDMAEGGTMEPMAMDDSGAGGVLAQAAPMPVGGGAGGNAGPNGAAPAPDGEGGWPGPNAESGLPLLIYQANIWLAVYEVTHVQEAVVQAARELGGYLSSMDDQSVTVRIPARRFQDGLGRVERLGDVTHRDVQATDVSEEFRDLEARLRNAEVVRERLEALLEQAVNVEEALAVHAQLTAITEAIERFKGRLRFLQDRVAFSTITVHFQPRPRDVDTEPDSFRLPFYWLDELGLRSLLDLG